MNSRQLALSFLLDTAVMVVVQVVDQFSFEMLHGLEFLQGE